MSCPPRVSRWRYNFILVGSSPRRCRAMIRELNLPLSLSSGRSFRASCCKSATSAHGVMRGRYDMNPSRELVPFSVTDISTFSKLLREQLARAEVAPLPSHLALLNMLARSAGYRNFQTLRAAPVSPPIAAPIQSDTSVTVTFRAIAMPRDQTLSRHVKRAITHFDTAGRLTRWPTQFAVQQQALWALWVRLPAKRALSEADVNRYLARYNAFGDFATLRRELVNAKLLWRTKDGRCYRKETAQPNEDTIAFLKTLLAAAVDVAPANSL
jgi:hypothetical protein